MLHPQRYATPYAAYSKLVVKKKKKERKKREKRGRGGKKGNRANDFCFFNMLLRAQGGGKKGGGEQGVVLWRRGITLEISNIVCLARTRKKKEEGRERKGNAPHMFSP